MTSESKGETNASPEATGRWLPALERYAPPLLFAALIVDACLQASLRPLWFDELLTYFIAGLPDVGQIVAALQAAADGQPLLSYLFVRASQACFGSGELATRLPSIVGFAAMSFALFVYVAKRLGRIYAMCGMLAVWLSWVYGYAYEARPYALLLGFTGGAFVFWREAIEGRRRLGVVGLAVCLVGILASHYYGGLLLVPFAVGELVRYRDSRRPDWAVWAAISLSPLVLVAEAPIWLSLRDTLQGAFWRPVRWRHIMEFYDVALGPAAGSLFLAAACATFAARFEQDSRPSPGRFPRHELFAVLTLAVTPISYVVFAKVATGAFVERYAAGCLFGIGVVAAIIIHGWLCAKPKASGIFLLVLIGGFTIKNLAPTAIVLLNTSPLERLRRHELKNLDAWLKDVREPVVVAEPFDFLRYQLYASEDVRSKLIYLTSRDLAIRHLGHDSVEVAFVRLSPFVAMNTVDYETFRKGREEFLALTNVTVQNTSWVEAQLRVERAEATPLHEDEGLRLWRFRDHDEQGAH